jgi:hypothetical protein
MTAPAHALSISITLATVVALFIAGFVVALTTQVFGGGHLILAPLLIASGGSLLVRLAVVQSRRCER